MTDSYVEKIHTTPIASRFSDKICVLSAIDDPAVKLREVAQLLKLDPNNAELLGIKLDSLIALDCVTEDIGFLRKFCWYKSLDARGFYYLHLAFLAQHDDENALIALAYCLSVDPQFPGAEDQLSALLNKYNASSLKLSFLTVGRIGHMITEPDSWLRQQQNHKSKTLHLFLSEIGDDYVPANAYLYGLLKDKLQVVESLYWHKLYKSRPLLLACEFYQKMPFDLMGFKRKKASGLWPESDYLRLQCIQAESKPPLTIPASDIQDCTTFLTEQGMDPQKPFVCLHVRDSAYLEKTVTSRDCSYHDYRDAKISSYAKAIQYLLDKGYTVIRIGEITNQYLDINHDSYLDMHQLNIANKDKIEVILISQCEFFISSTSGPQGVAAAFDKPILGVNIVPFNLFYPCYSRILPKRYQRDGYNIAYSDLLNGVEIVTQDGEAQDLLACLNGNQLSASGVSIIDNSEAEILDAVIEFESLVLTGAIFEPLNRQPSDYRNKVRSRDFVEGNFEICNSFIGRFPALFC